MVSGRCPLPSPPDGSPEAIEARLASLDRKNRELRRELARLAEDRKRREAEFVEAEVTTLIEEGKVAPADREKLTAALVEGHQHPFQYDGALTDIFWLVVEVLRNRPAVAERQG